MLRVLLVFGGAFRGFRALGFRVRVEIWALSFATTVSRGP